MKKFIVAILAVIALAALTACSLQAVDSNTGGDGPAAVTIGKPAILLNGDNSVSWSAVSGATEYVVEVNGSEQPAQADPGFAPITEAGTYQIRVKGVSGEYSGEWSNTVSYTVKEKAPAIEYFAKPIKDIFNEYNTENEVIKDVLTSKENSNLSFLEGNTREASLSLLSELAVYSQREICSFL